MTNSEFSDSFDALLNSYSAQAQFGEQSNRGDIVLDEYEKSVLLTKAQDIIVKTYFDRSTNSDNAGFDDNTRRQVDFSSLITTATLIKAEDQSSVFDDRGILYNMPTRSATSGVSDPFDPTFDETFHTNGDGSGAPDVLFILNEKLITTVGSGSSQLRKNYVIVPINYKEYDREMSRPYSQPLKKQAWRLLQNNEQGFDIKTELIPRWNLSEGETIVAYKIRYIRRPYPIILLDLPDGLNIEGLTKQRSCELNPILHADILQKAFELAVATRSGVSRQSEQR